jgi:chemotaxis protein MotB
MADEKPIIVVKKKGHHGGHHGGAWKVAYADFVTAMMAFFMVMWLVGTADNPTKQAVAAYFRKPGIFETGTGKPLQVGGAGIFSEELAPSKDPGVESGTAKKVTGPESLDPTEEASKKPAETDGITILVPEVESEGEVPLEKTGLGGESEELKKFAAQLKDGLALAPEIKRLLGEVDITIEPDGIRIEIVDTDQTSMFASGSAQIAPEAIAAFSKIAEFIRQVPYPIDIIGHTDAKQFSSRFTSYSNWELSADRANAARRLLEREGVDPTRIRGVLGQADRVPKLVDDPIAAANRRIELKLRLPSPTPEERVPPPPPPEAAPAQSGITPRTDPLFPEAPVIGPSPVFDF